MSKGNAPVKYFAGIITNRTDIQPEIINRLEKYFGKADFIGMWHQFSHTNYYEAEMGPNLMKCFVSFERLMEPELLYKTKYWAVKTEDKFKIGSGRSVNIDPGYIDYFKLILVSGKYGNHKVAVGKGAWADFTMTYSKGEWHPMPWCFPDFAQKTYDNDLKEIRRIFKKQRLSIPDNQ